MGKGMCSFGELLQTALPRIYINLFSPTSGIWEGLSLDTTHFPKNSFPHNGECEQISP